jgi:hypothetical protein
VRKSTAFSLRAADRLKTYSTPQDRCDVDVVSFYLLQPPQ